MEKRFNRRLANSGNVYETENWNDEDTIGAALAIVVHPTCHLGEIRQALRRLK